MSQMEKHHLTTKIDKLYSQVEYPLSEEMKKEMKALDDVMQQLMINSEKKCRHLFMGEIPFSAEFAYYVRRQKAYKELMKQRQNRADKSDTQIAKQAATAGILNAQNVTLLQAIIGYKVYRKEVRSIRPRTPQMRRIFMVEQIDKAIAEKNHKTVQDLRNQMRQEAEAKIWRGIKQATGKTRANTVTRVQKKEGDTTITYTTQVEIEEALSSEHSERFTLAENATINKGMIFTEIGRLADTDAAESILNGTYVPDDSVDDATREMLIEIGHIAKKLRTQQISLEITDQEFIDHWNHAKESTSSSVSTLHFGHYKAATKFST